MGVFNYVGAGLAEGFGAGMSAYGADQLRESDLRDREAEYRRREEERAAEQRRREDARLEEIRVREDARAARVPAKGEAHPGDDLIAVAEAIGVPRGKLTAFGAMSSGKVTTGEAQDAGQILRGEMPSRDVSLDDPGRRPDRVDDLAERGQSSAQVPKYTEARAAEIAVASVDGLRKAMGLAHVKNATDAAQAEDIEHKTTNTDRWRDSGGKDTAAGGAALIQHGKSPFSANGTNELDGTAPKGSVAASQIREHDARAASLREGGGKGGDKANRVQSTFTDNEGYRVAVMANGPPQRVMIDGKPVKSAEWGRRVDAEVGRLRKTIGAMDVSEDELRTSAERRLAGDSSGSTAPARPASAASGSLPPGARLVGTSKGKPVYELPDGRRVVQD